MKVSPVGYALQEITHSLTLLSQWNTCCAEAQRPEDPVSFNGDINYLGQFAVGQTDS